MPYSYAYPRPAAAVDGVLLKVTRQGPMEVLLIQRANQPFQHQWALPGGFVDDHEDPDHSIIREMAEETAAPGLHWVQIGTFGAPGRDPRGHSISVAYLSVIREGQLTLQAGDDARDLAWFSLDDLPDMAFDHDDIIATAMQYLDRAPWAHIPEWNLLDRPFRLNELYQLCSTFAPRLTRMDQPAVEAFLGQWVEFGIIDTT